VSEQPSGISLLAFLLVFFGADAGHGIDIDESVARLDR
jgi:hypothetical protein